MEVNKNKKHEECKLGETGHRLVEEGRRLQVEGQNVIDEGKRVEEEGHRLERECEEQKEKELYIFVNRIRFVKRQGVKREMTIDELTGLVGLTSETATVRRLLCGDELSEPLVCSQKIEPGDQFVVTRKCVSGGFQDRIEMELSQLRESSQTVDFVRGQTSYVIYRGVPTKTPGVKTDVIVAVPNGYPASMIDRAGFPENAPQISEVRGSPQEVVNVAGQSWRLISYHPHAGGGGLPWNPAIHGFHTYFFEVLSWLEVGK